MRVAIQGERGAFSHQAALAALGQEIELVTARDFDALFATLAAGAADRALVPVENTLTGSIHQNYDRLRDSPFHVVGEQRLRIEQCLIGLTGSSLEHLRRVRSHPVALGQCLGFFREHPGIEAVATADTAGAVREIVELGDPSEGALASRLAAPLHGAALLSTGVEDDPENYTRFLLLGRDPAPREGADKTSLVVVLENVPGALYRAMGAFALRGIDLTKLESRPLRGRPWEYAFYLDARGDPDGEVAEALEELRREAREVRVLGSYRERA
jgi:prephenate dehydratase